MNILFYILATLTFTSVQSYADRTLSTVTATEFANLQQNLEPSRLYFTFTTEPGRFSDWVANFPVEAEFLNLWPGYGEPMVPLRSGGQTKKDLTVFVARSRAVFNKTAAQMNLPGLISLPFISAMNSALRHREIPASDVLPLTAGSGAVTAFQWCNQADGADSFTRASRETDLSYLNPPHRNWCSGHSRSICVESCLTFDSGWRVGIDLANGMEDDGDDRKDYGAAFQSELVYYASEAEMGVNRSVQDLTGIASPLAGVIRQNIFYFNQAIHNATVTVFVQADPSNPTRTIVTSYFVFTVGTDTWNGHGGILREVLLGDSMFFNTDSGITAGLPRFTQGTALSITRVLDQP